MRSLILIGCLFLIGCGSGLPSLEQFAKVDLAMSQAEIEAILGPGREVATPPSITIPGPPRVGLPSKPRTVAGPPQAPPGAVWKMWGDEKKHLCLAFVNGKVVATQRTNLDVTMMQNGVTEAEAWEKMQADAKRDREKTEAYQKRVFAEQEATAKRVQQEVEEKHRAMILRGRRENGYYYELGQLAALLRGHTEKGETLTPADFGPLEEASKSINGEMKRLIESGELVVIWNAPKGSKVVAYPKMALESKARYLDGSLENRECTPEQLRQLLDGK